MIWRLGRLALLFGRAVWPAAWSVAVTEALEVVIVIRAVLGAQNPGAVKAVEDKLGEKLYICEDPEIVGAVGAAIYGIEELRQ